MEATVLRFLAFVGAELLFLLVSTAMVLSMGFLFLKSGQIKATYISVVAVVSGIVSMLFLILFLWILTGNGHASIFLMILLVSLVLMVLAELLWLVFGEPNVPWVERIFWHNRELDRLYPIVNKSTQLIAFAVFVIFPVYIGFGYFGDEFESARWDGNVLRASLVLMFGIGYLTLLPKSLYVMMSKNIAEGTRSRIFVSQLTQSVVVLMIVSFFVWTLNPDAATVPIIGRLVAFTPIVLYATLAYVIFFLIVPWLIGHFRYKAWVSKLDADSSHIRDELAAGLNSPSLENARAALVEAEKKIDENLRQLAEDKSYRLTEAVSTGAEEEIPLFRFAAEKSISRDPRFIHARKLKRLRQQIGEHLSELATPGGDKEKKEVLGKFGGAIADQMQVQSEAKSGQPFVLGAITAVVLAVVNPIMSAFGQKAVSLLGLSAG